MEEVRINSYTTRKLDHLVEILYTNDYFGFKEDARLYVNNIYDFIYRIPKHKRFPTANARYGKYYCRYKPNKNTGYYITFDVSGNKYLIRNIISNHTPEYAIYISG